MVVVNAGSPFLFIQSSPEPKDHKRAYSICRHPSFVREPIVYAGIRRPPFANDFKSRDADSFHFFRYQPRHEKTRLFCENDHFLSFKYRSQIFLFLQICASIG